MSTQDQSEASFYGDAFSLVSNDALFNLKGQNYTDRTLPNDQQWQYICDALGNGYLDKIKSTLNLTQGYWTATQFFPEPKALVRKIVMEQTPSQQRYVCVSEEVEMTATGPQEAVRAVRVF